MEPAATASVSPRDGVREEEPEVQEDEEAEREDAEPPEFLPLGLARGLVGRPLLLVEGRVCAPEVEVTVALAGEGPPAPRAGDHLGVRGDLVLVVARTTLAGTWNAFAIA